MGMRPKKPRFVDGVQLVDHLYPDPRKRTGFYSYVRPDNGKRKTFSRETVEQANAFALELTEVIGKGFVPTRTIPRRDQLAYYIPTYIAYQERINPKLVDKESWANQRWFFKHLARHSDFERLGQIDRVRVWWDDLGYHQQKQRHASFRRFFNWMMGQGLLPKLKFNPFTRSDEVPRLLVKQKVDKIRESLPVGNYAIIHAKALEMGYECLAIAMGISQYTALRVADVCKLTFDRHIVDGHLQLVIAKSEAQKGSARAARYKWDLSEHPILKALIDRARELSLINRRCPFIISHTPKRRVKTKDRQHLCQVLKKRISRMFNEVMKECGIEKTSFHEVRGLSATLYSLEGYEDVQIQALLAHEELSTTRGYQDAGALPYETITMKLKR